MVNLTPAKKNALNRLSTTDGRINALALDQRSVLKKMFAVNGVSPRDEHIEHFKKIASEEFTLYTSAILLDPEYGLPAAKSRNERTGLMLAYEKSGYDTSIAERLPEVRDDWSVLRLKEQGADAIKFLLYYDVGQEPRINRRKQIRLERLGSECAGEDIPFILELVSYDTTIPDTSSEEYAKVRPHKIIEMMKEFSKPRYHVDVLKVEVPVNMSYVDGFSTTSVLHSQEEASKYFKEQSEATPLPFVFLSAGMSAQRFQHTLQFAKKSGSSFNGVLSGRAIWRNGAAQFIEHGEEAARHWFRTEGKKTIEQLNGVVSQTAHSWREKISVQKRN